MRFFFEINVPDYYNRICEVEKYLADLLHAAGWKIPEHPRDEINAGDGNVSSLMDISRKNVRRFLADANPKSNLFLVVKKLRGYLPEEIISYLLYDMSL